MVHRQKDITHKTTELHNQTTNKWHHITNSDKKVYKKIKMDEMETPLPELPEGCLESGADPGVSTSFHLQVTHHLYPKMFLVVLQTLPITRHYETNSTVRNIQYIQYKTNKTSKYNLKIEKVTKCKTINLKGRISVRSLIY